MEVLLRYSLTQIVIVWQHLTTARLPTEEVSFLISVFISPQITTCVKEYFGMGTTLILGYIRNEKLLMCNIGDSRLYSYDENNLEQLSEDQTYVQFLYKTGKIKKEDIKIHPKRNVLMNALGTYPSLSIVTKIFNEKPKKIMVCSDGLYNLVEEEDVLSILNLKVDLNTKIDLLIDKANENGGTDNIAVGLLEEIL